MHLREWHLSLVGRFARPHSIGFLFAARKVPKPYRLDEDAPLGKTL